VYRVISNIKIVQQSSSEFPNRKSTLNFDFCNTYEASDGWQDLTNKGKVILPKNIYVRNENGKLISLGTIYGKPASNINVGGFTSNDPLLLRGDRVTIAAGYKYFNKAGVEILDTSQIFKGYISKVTSKKPLEFEVEDNMWKLKQVQAPIKTFSTSDTLEDILSTLIAGTGFTVNALTQTTFGEFTTGNETVAETLARLRRLYHFESYFRGDELRCGSLVYIEAEAKTVNFDFQGNIITDELDYRRRDDIVLSAVARNTIERETGKTTKDGQAKTEKVRLEVLVTFQGNGTVTKFVKTKGNDYPPNTGGERRELIFPGAKTTDELAKLAEDELKKYYYTGFKGRFTTFGIPFVKQGDNVQLKDPILPERNGLYKVKKVDYSGGVQGLRQVVSLDYKIL
jgi:hypothetical protein